MSVFFGWLARIGLWLVILTAATVLVVAVLIPRLTGARPFVILTGSMRPSLPPGTLVVTKPVDSSRIGVGTVITYQITSGEPQTVTHRVTAQGFSHDGERRFRTQGDANDTPDQGWVRAVQVRGTVWYAVPWLGYPARWLTGTHHQLLTYAGAAVLLGYAAYMFGSAITDRRGRRRRGETREAS